MVFRGGSGSAWCLALLFGWVVASAPAQGGVLGVAAGEAAADARPLLWANFDGPASDRVVLALDDGAVPYFALCAAGDPQRVDAGANTKGLVAAGLAWAPPSGGGVAEGEGEAKGYASFTKQALQRCATVAEFAELLGAASCPLPNGAFVVLDGAGAAAALVVVAGNVQRMDAAAAPNGRLVFAGDGAAGARQLRAAAVLAAPQATPLSARYLLQQMVRDVKAPPDAAKGERGLVDVRAAVHATNTVAGFVGCGVKAGDDPRWTSLWALLGPPLLVPGVPLWPIAGAVPRAVAGDPRSAFGTACEPLVAQVYTPGDGRDGAPDRWLRQDVMARFRRSVLFGEADLIARVDEAVAAWRVGAAEPVPATLRAFQERAAKLALDGLVQLGTPQAAGK
jgi:hypothetical protein